MSLEVSYEVAQQIRSGEISIADAARAIKDALCLHLSSME